MQQKNKEASRKGYTELHQGFQSFLRKMATGLCENVGSVRIS